MDGDCASLSTLFEATILGSFHASQNSNRHQKIRTDNILH